jgi:hypothetical protein
MAMMPALIIKLAARFPHPNPGGTISHSTKPASGQVAGYPPKGVLKAGNPLSGKPDVELHRGANESLRELHVNGAVSCLSY